MFKLKSFIIYINVIDVLIFVNIYIKRNYDKRHKFIFLKKKRDLFTTL